MIETVTKRDGHIEPFDPSKLNKWAEWASLECDVQWNQVVFDAVRGLHENVETENIHQALIDTCVHYQDSGHAKMAARLLVGQIYKEAFEDYSIPSLKEFYREMVEFGHWEDMGYSDDELDYLDSVIDHTRDFTYEYATVKQFYDKYAVKKFGRCLESLQMAMMGVAMSNMRNEEDRLKDVVGTYEELASIRINLPTPSLNGERTSLQASPSCCVISGNDTVNSIGAASHVAYTMTAQRSGIGTELSIRSLEDPVKGGMVEHGGKYSYYNVLDRQVKANTQIARGGSVTMTYTCMDPELDMLIRFKSLRQEEAKRLMFMDYSMAINTSFLMRAAKNQEWALTSIYYAPKLHELFYAGDHKAFEEEYQRVLKDKSVPKTFVNARKMLKLALRVRVEQGRVYFTFIDNVNYHTPFKEAIRLSNLCQEVLLPTNGFTDVSNLYSEDLDGEIALCYLASIVVGNIEDDTQYEKTAYYASKFVDNTIENAKYPFANVKMTAQARRSIGIGMTDVAHWMAMNGYKYDDEEGRNAIHRLAERHSYYLHKASARLAKERGACEWMHKTKYADDQPWLPIDTYKRKVDEFHSQELIYNWPRVRRMIEKYGVRFSVHEAFMPVESSSVFTNSTNGVYPVRKFKMFKKSRKGFVFFQAPDYEELKDKYQMAWDIDNKHMIMVYSIIQKFTGQSISSDLYHDYGKKPKVSMKEMLEQVFLAAMCGQKTWYYFNSQGKESKTVEQPVAESNKPAMMPDLIDDDDEEGCEDCKL